MILVNFVIKELVFYLVMFIINVLFCLKIIVILRKFYNFAV